MLDENGFEVPDPKPVAVPVGWKKPPSLNDRIAQMVRQELSARAEEVGMESFEDADDFDIPDDPADPNSPWEEDFEANARLNADLAEVRKKSVENREKLIAEGNPTPKPSDVPKVAEPDGEGQ